MNRCEFFKLIKEKSENVEDYIIELLKLRGFFIEKNNNRYYLSDNAHIDDSQYLNGLLAKYDLGYVDEINGLIQLATVNGKAELLENEFYEGMQIPMEVCCRNRRWDWYAGRPYGKKVPVSYLEPFVARYVKAISSVGVETIGSCDGNHKGKTMMYIDISPIGAILWHKLMWENLLNKKFDIDWINDYTGIRFYDNQYGIYFVLSKAAEFIYENRFEFRRIKLEGFKDLKKSFCKKHTNEEIKNIVTDKINRLFETVIFP